MKHKTQKNLNPMIWSHFQMWFTNSFFIAASVTFVVGFFRHIGFNEFQIAVYGSAIGLASLFSVIGSWIAQRRGQYKKTVMWFYAAAAFFCIGGVFTGAFGGPGKMVPVVVIIIMALYLLFIYLPAPVIIPWLHSIIGDKEWPRFYSTRCMVADFSILVTSLLVGAYLGGTPSTIDFVAVFTVASLFGLIAVLFLRHTPAPAITERYPDIKVYVKKIAAVLRRQEIRGLMVITFIKSFAYGFIVPFQPLFLLEDLKLSYTRISFLLCLSTVFSIMCYKLWAHFHRRIGYHASLKWNLALSVLDPFFWVFAKARNPVPVFLAYSLFGFNGFQGAVNAGYWPSLVGSLLTGSEEHQKPINVSLYYLMSGIATMIAPLISGAIIHNFKVVSFQVTEHLFISIDSYRFIFIIAGLLLVVTAVYSVFCRNLRKDSD